MRALSAFRFPLSALLLGGLLLPGLALAERPLTYGEALGAAVAANPTLTEARLSRDQAEASLLGSRGLFDPSFRASGTWSDRDYRGFFQGFPFESETKSWDLGAELSGTAATGTTYGLTWGLDHERSRFVTDFGTGDAETTLEPYVTSLQATVTQQLLRGHRLAYNMQNVTRAKVSLGQAQLTVEQVEQSTLASTAQAYWTWVYTAQLTDIAQDRVKLAEEDHRVGELKLEAGDLAPLELTRLEAALVQARSAALEARQAERQAADTLLLAMGEEPGQDLLPATAPGEVPVFELDVERAVEVALAQNLDLALARDRAQSAALDHSVARHGTLPSLYITGSAGVGAQDMDTASGAITGIGGDEAYPNYSLGGTLDLPLGNRAARGERERTLAALHAAEGQVTSTERTVRSQVALQVEALASAREKVELADANSRLAEQTLRLEQALAETGRAILKDVLEARAAADQARAEAAKARTDFRMAQVELLRLQGLLEVELP